MGAIGHPSGATAASPNDRAGRVTSPLAPTDRQLTIHDLLTPPVPRAEDLPAWYAAYGRTARYWVTGGPYRPAELITVSWRAGGANSVLVYGPEPGALLDVARELDAMRSPAVIVVAGAALAHVQAIADAGWVCIGNRPFMHRPARLGAAPTDVRRHDRYVFTELTSPLDMITAWQLADEALGGNISAMVTDMATLDGLRVWALREDDEIISCATTVQADGIVGVWNVATQESRQRAGFGTRLLHSVHAAVEQSTDVEHFLLHSSPTGSRLYESLGYHIVEWWQAWSRPRWVLGSS